MWPETAAVWPGGGVIPGGIYRGSVLLSVTPDRVSDGSFGPDVRWYRAGHYVSVLPPFHTSSVEASVWNETH